jgi:hypothetical protein
LRLSPVSDASSSSLISSTNTSSTTRNRFYETSFGSEKFPDILLSSNC